MKSGLKIIFLFIVVCSCKEQKSSMNRQLPSYHYELVKAGKNKCFELDAETRYNAFYFSEHGETRFSREYNGENFIYSFYADEYIYVTSVNHQEIDKIHVKSKYIDKIETEEPPSDPNLAVKRILEKAHYGDLIYDQYRDVYYRFVYPETELDPNRTYMGTVVFGRNIFSVIILDKNFNIIGETLFPEDIYNSFVFFVHRDGLYISRDYQINFNQPEDQMNFELFKLTDPNTSKNNL